jgi:DNA-binding IclR family transcriptional regulator
MTAGLSRHSLREAGVSLDRALFPLLVRLSAASAMRVAKLAEQVGRDPSTVSRQLVKLEQLGLVRRPAACDDLRVRDSASFTLAPLALRALRVRRRVAVTFHGDPRDGGIDLPKIVR